MPVVHGEQRAVRRFKRANRARFAWLGLGVGFGFGLGLGLELGLA